MKAKERIAELEALLAQAARDYDELRRRLSDERIPSGEILRTPQTKTEEDR